MPNEIYHKNNWGNANAEGFGDVYFDKDSLFNGWVLTLSLLLTII